MKVAVCAPPSWTVWPVPTAPEPSWTVLFWRRVKVIWTRPLLARPGTVGAVSVASRRPPPSGFTVTWTFGRGEQVEGGSVAVGVAVGVAVTVAVAVGSASVLPPGAKTVPARPVTGGALVASNVT